jgi:hypothetical protein
MSEWEQMTIDDLIEQLDHFPGDTPLWVVTKDRIEPLVAVDWDEADQSVELVGARSIVECH